MAEINIENLVGISLNPVEGQRNPTELSNLHFDRAGGYTPFANALAITVVETGITTVDVLVGRDEDGLTTYIGDGAVGISDDLKIRDESGVTTYSSASVNTGNTSRTHLSRVGIVQKAEQYLIRQVDRTRNTTTTFPVTVTFSTGTQTAAISQTSVVNVLSIPWVPTDGGKFALASSLSNINLTVSGATTSANKMLITGPALTAGVQIDLFMSRYFNIGGAPFDNTPYIFLKTLTASTTSATAFTVPLTGVQLTSDGFTVYRHGFGQIAEAHNRRYYFNFTQTKANYDFTLNFPKPETLRPWASTGEWHIGYSEIGWVNVYGETNFFVLNPTASTKLTAMKSTPNGLLIFGDRETWLMRSDPALTDFAVQRFSGTIGNDDGVLPARLGGVVFIIFLGEIYAISLGMGDVDFGSGIENISQLVFDPTDKFVEVTADPAQLNILARTANDNFLRYDPRTKQWFTDLGNKFLGGSFSGLTLPSNTGIEYFTPGSPAGIRVIDFTGTITTTDSIPSVTYTDLNLVDKKHTALLRNVWTYTNDEYTGTPSVSYNVQGLSGTIPMHQEGGNRFRGVFPAGLTGRKLDKLQISYNNMQIGDTVEPPIAIEFVPRHRSR